MSLRQPVGHPRPALPASNYDTCREGRFQLILAIFLVLGEGNIINIKLTYAARQLLSFSMVQYAHFGYWFSSFYSWQNSLRVLSLS